MKKNDASISFIIPLFNHLKQSKEMLASLLATLPHHLNYEIILIDDGSMDGTQLWMRQLTHKNIRLIFNKKNLGYAKSNNKAVRMAKGNILCLLNNDLILLTGWLEPMMDILYNPIINAGVVGNIQYKVIDNSLDHAGIQVNHLAKIEHINHLSSTSPLFNCTFAVTGACLLLFREDFIRVGGFDEQFENGCEDVDLCLKLRQQHKFSYVANTSAIKHHVSLTRNVTSQVNEKNSQLLFSKWRSVIFRELNKVWLDLLCYPDENNAAQLIDFNLKDICYQKPQLASFMLANSVLQREEVRWREIFNKNNKICNKKMILKKVGFYWDRNHPSAFIEGKAWITLAKGYTPMNIFISGKIIDLVLFDALEISVDINGIQAQNWINLPLGHFNLRVANPVLSDNFSSIMTISLHFKNKNRLIPLSIFSQACKMIRFSHISINQYKIPLSVEYK